MLRPPEFARNTVRPSRGRITIACVDGEWHALPVRILRCPIPFPALSYYQLWHDVTHASAAGRWLRDQVREVARTLASHALPARPRKGNGS